jgi:hypothetical protein
MSAGNLGSWQGVADSQIIMRRALFCDVQLPVFGQFAQHDVHRSSMTSNGSQYFRRPEPILLFAGFCLAFWRLSSTQRSRTVFPIAGGRTSCHLPRAILFPHVDTVISGAIGRAVDH